MAQKWPKNGLHHPMMSSSHHPIITTSHHPIIASSHLGTPHLLWKWLTNTSSQKISLGGQTISLRFLTPQRGSINPHFAAFFKLYKICTVVHRSNLKFCRVLVFLQMLNARLNVRICKMLLESRENRWFFSFVFTGFCRKIQIVTAAGILCIWIKCFSFSLRLLFFGEIVYYV